MEAVFHFPNHVWVRGLQVKRKIGWGIESFKYSRVVCGFCFPFVLFLMGSVGDGGFATT
jgi:hypothetical protein